MNIQVRSAEYQDVQAMRDLYRQEANCQLIRDSALIRGLADPYLILVNDRIAGYGSVNNKYDRGRLTEFFALPDVRGIAQLMFRELLVVSQATQIEAQTNMPLTLMMLYDFASSIVEESLLFQDAFTTNLSCPGSFRPLTPEETTSIFPHHGEPVGDWVVEARGSVVATGGFYCHYNPPYGDIFMEVSEPFRRQGFGSYLVQEVKRTCYEAGRKPAARCHPANVASRRTLQKAGLLPCGRMLVGGVVPLAWVDTQSTSTRRPSSILIGSRPMVLIRAERAGDADAIHAIHSGSFPAADEARLVDLLRDAGHLSVSLVAEADGEVIGHVAFSPVTAASGEVGAGLAPVAVLAAHRRQGVAARLIEAGLAGCRSAGFDWAVVLGEPGYYSRFGFRPAQEVGLSDEYGGGPAFQAMELAPGGLPAGAGLVRYGPEFAAFG